MDNSTQTIDDIYLLRPTPEYGQAFDLATRALKPADSKVLAVVSSTVHAVELLKRCPNHLEFASTPAFDAAIFVAAARDWAWGPIEAVSLEDLAGPYGTIVWAEPEVYSTTAVLRALRSRAIGAAALHVIASSALRSQLPAWQTQPHPALHPVTPGVMIRLLRKTGWQIESFTSFHGPRSILLGWLVRLFEASGRSDWGDRCRFAMRANYRQPGWLWPLSPVALIQARTIKR